MQLATLSNRENLIYFYVEKDLLDSGWPLEFNLIDNCGISNAEVHSLVAR